MQTKIFVLLPSTVMVNYENSSDMCNWSSYCKIGLQLSWLKMYLFHII